MVAPVTVNSRASGSKLQSVDEFIHNSTLVYPGMPAHEDPSPGVPINPDLVAGFEHIRFQRPTLPDGLLGANLLNETIVPDELLLSFLGAIPAVSGPGDVNNDGVADNLDITPFIAALAAENETGFGQAYPEGSYAAADVDGSGRPNNLDITPFIDLLTAAASESAAVPEPASLVLLLPALMMARRAPRRLGRRVGPGCSPPLGGPGRRAL